MEIEDLRKELRHLECSMTTEINKLCEKYDIEFKNISADVKQEFGGTVRAYLVHIDFDLNRWTK